MSADTAPAAMPGEEEVARLVDAYAFKSWQQAHDYEIKTTGDAEEAVRFADWSVGKRVDEAREKARAVLDLFAPILAEKEREKESLKLDRDAAQLNEAEALDLMNEYKAALEAAEAALAAERALLVRAKDYIVHNADSLAMNAPATLLVEEIVAAIRAGE